MQIFVEIAKKEYDIVEFYLQLFLEATSYCAKSDDEKIGTQAIEFWTSLAEEEYLRVKKNGHNKNYIAQVTSLLLSLLLECIQKLNIQDEDDDSDEMGVALSAGCCINAISVLVGSQIMQPIIQFVGQNIQNTDWTKRYSSLIALGSITESPDKQTFTSVLIPSLNNLLNMFQDPNAKVREAIAWVFSRISEEHQSIITAPNALQIIMTTLVTSLRDRPKVSSLVCKSIEFISAYVGRDNDKFNQNTLTPYFQGIYSALLENAKREVSEHSQVNLMLSSFSALQQLCESAAVDSYDILYQNMMPILGNIENLLNLIDTNPKAKELLDYNAGLLQIMLVKVGSKLDDETANKILVLLKMIFDRMKRVTENGLIILNGLINGVGSRIKIDIIGSYIVHALKQDDDEITRQACGIVIDLANALEAGIEPYLADFVPNLLVILKNREVSR